MTSPPKAEPVFQYLLHPRYRSSTKAIGPDLAAASQKDVVRRVQDIESLRASEASADTLARWIDAHPPGITIKRSLGAPNANGTAVVTMTREEAERLRQELPDVEVLSDEPSPQTPARTQLEAAAGTGNPRWHLDAIGLTAGRASGRIPETGRGIEIAVLDAGVNERHPALGRSIPWIDVDGSFHSSGSVSANAHGTAVAGLIGAEKFGVAPGASLLSVMVMSPGADPSPSGLHDALIATARLKMGQPVHIISLSIGLNFPNPAIAEAVDMVRSVGILPVVAAGNRGVFTADCPARLSTVIAVGGTTIDGRVEDSSASRDDLPNGRKVPDLVAPADPIYSCDGGTGFQWVAGTSFAAPIVAGLLGLALERWPGIPAEELLNRVRTHCTPLANDAPARQGAGLVTVAFLTSDSFA